MITPEEILKNLSYFIIVTDSSGRVVFCNKKIEELDLFSLEKIGKREIVGSDGETYTATSYRTQAQLSYDHLTGLLSKEGFKSQLKDLHQDILIKGGTYTVVFGDLDHFKEINDTIGHLKADTILKQVAATIRSSIRKEDFASRFGGDEFIIALVGTNEEIGLKKVEEIRRKIEQIEYIGDDIHGNQIRLAIESSFGIAEYERGMDSLAVLNNADLALYDAKMEGRAQVKPFSVNKSYEK